MDYQRPAKKKSSTYYPVIDGLRAIAILWVVICHTCNFFLPSATLKNVYLTKFADLGFLGVDLFFVISGFLITGILIEDYNQPINISRFYIRRFFKIYPQYISAFAFCLILPLLLPCLGRYIHDAGLTMADYAKFPLFLQQYSPHALPTFLHSWSLTIEEHFYFLYPLLILVVFRITPATARRDILAAIIGALILLVALYRIHCHGKDILSTLAGSYLPFFTTLMRIDAILAGCLIKILEPRLARLNKTSAALFMASSLIIYIHLFCMDGPKYYHPKILFSWLAAAFLFLAAYLNFHPVSTGLTTRPLQWIGKNSYGIYLWHFPIIFIMAPLTVTHSRTLIIFAYIPLSLLLGAISTKTIEKYSLKIRQQLAP